jgi:hypothetical protein
MKDPNVVTPALSDEQVMEMNQLEYERKLDMEEGEIRRIDLDLTEADFWDGDASHCE